MNFEQIQWNKVFCRMCGFAVIEVMTMSRHLSNIDEKIMPYKYKGFYIGTYVVDL